MGSGRGSRLDPLLQIIGLSSKPESEKSGLINRVIGLLTEETAPAPTEIDEDRPDLLLEDELSDLPVVASYRWNRRASECAAQRWLVVVGGCAFGVGGLAHLFCDFPPST